jgi:hypothetical protein
MSNMKARTSLARFEGDLQGMAGNITLYRRGINEFYLSQYSWIYEQLEAVRGDLEDIGMYERCRDALRQAEEWVRQGTENDEKAQDLLLEVGRELAHASGSYAALERKYRAANDEGKPQKP